MRASTSRSAFLEAISGYSHTGVLLVHWFTRFSQPDTFQYQKSGLSHYDFPFGNDLWLEHYKNIHQLHCYWENLFKNMYLFHQAKIRELILLFTPFPAGWKCCDTVDILHYAQAWRKQTRLFSWYLHSLFWILGKFQCIVSLPRFVFRMQAPPDEVWSLVYGVAAARLCCVQPQRFCLSCGFFTKILKIMFFSVLSWRHAQSDRWLSSGRAGCCPRSVSECLQAAA